MAEWVVDRCGDNTRLKIGLYWFCAPARATARPAGGSSPPPRPGPPPRARPGAGSRAASRAHGARAHGGHGHGRATRRDPDTGRAGPRSPEAAPRAGPRGRPRATGPCRRRESTVCAKRETAFRARTRFARAPVFATICNICLNKTMGICNCFPRYPSGVLVA